MKVGTMNQIDPMPPRPADQLFYVTAVVISLAIGWVNALSRAQDALWRGAPYDLGTQLLWEMTSIAVILLLMPLLLAARAPDTAIAEPRRTGRDRTRDRRDLLDLPHRRHGGLAKAADGLARGRL